MYKTQDDDDVDVAEASSLTKLDSCTVQVDPPMTPAMEHLRLPENLMKQLNIVDDLTPTGLVLTGENTTYQLYLLIIYLQPKTAYYCQRCAVTTYVDFWL